MNKDDTVKILTRCPVCNEQHFIPVKFCDYIKWKKDGVYVQDAFPYLNEDEREMLLSGICRKCWDEAMTDDEDE